MCMRTKRYVALNVAKMFMPEVQETNMPQGRVCQVGEREIERQTERKTDRGERP